MSVGPANLASIRVQDPILTEVARGYFSPEAPVADVLFPIVTVAARAGRILSFGPDDFKLVNTRRAPGANTKRIQYGYASEPFSLYDYRLEGTVHREHDEEARNVPGIDLASGAIRKVQNVMAIERENQAAQIAQNPAMYDTTNKTALSSTSMWDNPASNPADDIDEAKEVIRQQIGREPNVMTLGPRVLRKLRRHPKLLDKISTSTDRTPLSIEQLAKLFDLERIVVGKAVVHNGTKFADLWANNAILAFTTPGSAADQGSPSFGYTYRLKDRPWVEEPYFENNTVTWYYPTSDAYQAALTGKAAGFLFSNVVTAQS